jgi:hypothetical protein
MSDKQASDLETITEVTGDMNGKGFVEDVSPRPFYAFWSANEVQVKSMGCDVGSDVGNAREHATTNAPQTGFLQHQLPIDSMGTQT